MNNIKILFFKLSITSLAVQADNARAINFYKKNGFKTLGQFSYNGENYDMILEL